VKNLGILLIAGLLFVPLATAINLADAVVGGPYTNKVSVELGASDRSSGKAFSPEEIVVSVGTTVVWTNKDTVGHTIVSGNASDPNAGTLFDTGPRWPAGAKYEHTFDTVGEFQYFCTLYPWMTGKVIVAEVVIQEDGSDVPIGIPEVPVEIPEDEILEEDILDEDRTLMRNFVVEDGNGDRMNIKVSSSNQEAFDALTSMVKTGETKWIGGKIQSFKNDYGFRFEPATVIVAETVPQESDASQFKAVQKALDYWETLDAVYISGNVVSVQDRIAVNYQKFGFNVTTSMTNGGVENITVDPSATSILVTLNTGATKAGNLTITLPRNLIDSTTDTKDKKFVVKVDDEEVKYKAVKLEKGADTQRRLKIPLPAGAAQVEIIGTQVVPEFPLGLAVILAALVSVIVVMTRSKITRRISYV
jgi:plastocyanin